MGTIRVSKETLNPSSVSTSSSTSRTETVNGSHEFKITGYSLSKGMGIGKYIPSETFMVGGEGSEVRALFELSLMDQSGNGRHKVHTHFGRALDTGPYTLKYRGSMWITRLLLMIQKHPEEDLVITRVQSEELDAMEAVGTKESKQPTASV
ncbi:hypothetical protein TEA_027644 [Camellia sinensis var. sinensis]|uniref:Uncharacterized protein n=1 Tax=Camellia sinensis var. sinensis TaxID=542762 RepID=A0A4S4EQN1_CAMSN|nr:hypothetical protein TEA_027644 [Camellia sinensis var. sinensis]